MNDVERELRELGDRAGGDAAYHSVPARRIVRRARLRRLALAVPAAAAVVVAAVAFPALAPERRGNGALPVDLAAVARATEDAGTARVELRMTMEMNGEARTTRGVGEVDFERGRAHLRMEGPGSERAEVISVGDTTYQRTGGSGWVKLAVQGGAFGIGAGPADLLPYLQATADEVTNLGEDDIDGVEVTHYRAVIDPEEFPVPPGAEVELDPMEVWVDGLGRLRKLAFGSSVREGGFDATLDMTMGLSDFGIEVDVVAPDPEDVTTGPEAFGPGESSSGSDTGDGNELGLPDPTVVFGNDGMSGPHLVFSRGSADALMCVQSLPLGATRVSLVDEVSGRRLVVMGAGQLEDHAAISASGGCDRAALDHADEDALAADPTRYSLVVETDGGETVTIALEDTAAPADG